MQLQFQLIRAKRYLCYKYLNKHDSQFLFIIDENEERVEEHDSDLGQDEQKQEQLKNAIITGDWNKYSEKCYITKEKIHLKGTIIFIN